MAACGSGEPSPVGDGGDAFDGDVGGDQDTDVAADADGDLDTDAELDAETVTDADVEAERDADEDSDVLGPPVDPNVDGPLGVTEESVRVGMGDGGPRERTIDVDLYLPTDLSDAPYPVVIFSHGFQLSGGHYATTGRRLASHGLVAVLPSYGDTIISPRSHTDLAADVSWLIDWVSEEVGTDGALLFGVADATRIGAGGHSRGGKHSILAAIGDPRIIASFNVDPVDVCHPIFGESEGNPSVTPELMGGFTIPGGFLGAGRSAEAPMGQACAPEAQNYHQYFIEATSPAFEYLLPAAGHLDFADRCGMLCSTCSSGDDPVWNRGFAAATMVSFYRVFLAEDGRYRPWVDGDPVTSLSERVVFASR